jgi:GTPase SAR1 family protein
MISTDFSDNYNHNLKQLKELYNTKLLEIEKRYLFDRFHSDFLRASDFDAKPMVLLIGPYSVGKTSFIQYMLGRKFPGGRVGVEPTTDRFVAVMYDKEDKIIPGNALSVDRNHPFHSLNAFGNNFLTRFEGSFCNSDILDKITFIDTPGILSGEQQRIQRGYEFTSVSKWFCERSDMIILFFDAHKLDISDELSSVIESLKGHEDKVRVVLNKADSIGVQDLSRVYGSLMWSLGKVLKTPEVVKVFIGSFTNEPYQNEDFSKLFIAEQKALIDDILELPRNSAVRKINELVKRCRLVRTHMHLIAHLKQQMPLLFGKESRQKELIHGLSNEYVTVSRSKQIPLSDFPKVEDMQQKLSRFNDIATFPGESERLSHLMEKVITVDLPNLMTLIGPPKSREEESTNPFDDIPWEITKEEKMTYDQIFEVLGPVNGKVKVSAIESTLIDTGMERPLLSKIWNLADIERKPKWDSDQFAVALYLTEQVKRGQTLPETLPYSLIPPSKRKLFKK